MVMAYLSADIIIKKIESKSQSDALAVESLTLKLGEVEVQLRSKEDEIKLLIVSRHSLEKEKGDLEFKNDQLANKLTLLVGEIKDLESFVHGAAAQLTELDRQSLAYSDKFEQLNNLNSSFIELVNQKMEMVAKHSTGRYMKLHGEFLSLTLERDTLQLKNQELNFKITELQKVRELTMAEHLKERHQANERIQKLESEAETLYAKKTETELLISKQSEEILSLSEKSKSDNNKMVDYITSFTYEKNNLVNFMLTSCSNLPARFPTQDISIRD